VIYRLGTRNFTKPWTNPACCRTVSVKRSSNGSEVGVETPGAGKVESWIGREPTHTHTQNLPGSWFEVDLGNVKVEPTLYLLRSYVSGGGYTPMS